MNVHNLKFSSIRNFVYCAYEEYEQCRLAYFGYLNQLRVYEYGDMNLATYGNVFPYQRVIFHKYLQYIVASSRV